MFFPLTQKHGFTFPHPQPRRFFILPCHSLRSASTRLIFIPFRTCPKRSAFFLWIRSRPPFDPDTRLAVASSPLAIGKGVPSLTAKNSWAFTTFTFSSGMLELIFFRPLRSGGDRGYTFPVSHLHETSQRVRRALFFFLGDDEQTFLLSQFVYPYILLQSMCRV